MPIKTDGAKRRQKVEKTEAKRDKIHIKHQITLGYKQQGENLFGHLKSERTNKHDERGRGFLPPPKTLLQGGGSSRNALDKEGGGGSSRGRTFLGI